MKQFKNIFVFLQKMDQSEEALIKRALLLAIRNKAEITFSAGTSSVPRNLEELIQFKLGENVVAIHKKSSRDKLELCVEPHIFDGQRIHYQILEGRPFIAVIKAVLERSFDLVMIEPEANESVNRFFFGATVMNLLRKCPCPVWVFKPALHGTYNRILAAIDTSTKRENEKKLNESIIEISETLAAREDAELHVIHCWEGSGESVVRSNVPPHLASVIEEYTRHAQETARQDFETVLQKSQHGLDRKIHHFEHGIPGEIVPHLAYQHNIELLIMGTLGRSGLKGLFIGNSAEKIIDAIECSVLALKPEGFKSPVHL